jgi:hypothetical protein
MGEAEDALHKKEEHERRAKRKLRDGERPKIARLAHSFGQQPWVFAAIHWIVFYFTE